MLRSNNFFKTLLVLAALMLFQGNAIAQKSCAFIGAGAAPDGNEKDSLLIAHLMLTYDLTIVDDDDIMNGVFTKESLSTFDFGFVSESASTWKLQSAPGNFYKTSPVPMFYTELYASQSAVAGWISADGSFGATNDSTGVGGKVVIVDDTGHQLAAGFSKDDQVVVVDGTNDAAGLRMLTFSTPEVDHVPIAVYEGDPSLSVAFGIEEGTKLYNAEGTEVVDSLATIHRVAAVGVFAKANDFITADGYALIDAGIQWVLEPDSGPTEDYVNTAITAQTSAFTATFNAVPSADSVDGVIGFSKELPDSYGDYSIKVLFNNEGFIKASNGNGFEAASDIPYSAETSYAIKIVGNVLEQDYSVWVDDVLIGENFTFDPDPGVVDVINYRSVKMSFGAPWGGNVGTVDILDFAVDYPNGNNINASMAPQTEAFMLEFDAKPTADLMDGVLGFMQEKPGLQWDYSAPVKLLFNNEGFVTARDSGSFAAENEFAYTAGTTYKVRMVFDMPSKTYDAWIAGDDGNEIVLADDYNFDGVLDTVQWRTVVMSFGSPWGGAIGFVETTNFVISDAPVEGPTEDFVNTAIPLQTSAFTAQFHAVPTADLVDGVIGFSKDLPDSYGDYSIKVLFANDGFIKASNGNSFEAAVEVAYTAGTSYAIKVVGNVLEQDFSVWVDNVLIGENFAFDPDPGVVDSLNYRSVKMSFGSPWGGNVGTVDIQEFSIGYPNGDNINASVEPQTDSFMLEFDAKPTADLMDGVLGFMQAKPGNTWDYSAPVKLLFNNEGFVTARDSGSFATENEFSYTAGTTYKVRMVFDIPTQTYDAWIAPDGGEEVAIADDYNFDGVLDTVQWRTVVMSFGSPWGGAVGFVETRNYVISEAPDAVDPERFQNTEIAAQTSSFAALFHATPTADSIDGVVGFSQELPGSYGDFAIKLLFANDGLIKASNANGFEAASEMPYTAGTRYTVKIVGNILEQDYSIWINNEVLGYNFAFDPDPGLVDTIKYRSVKMSIGGAWGGADGNVEIPLFMIDYPNEMNVTSPVEPQAENFSVTFDAKPTTDLIDGVIGFAQDRPGNTDWGQPVKLLFNNAGYITARDSGSFKTVDSLAYTGGNTYKIRMTFDFPSQTYDAWVDTEDGDVIIANDFHFDGVLDTVQWRTIIMSFGGAWGGAVGFVEITNFEISDSILTGIENGVMSLPENYALLQNYPNPFNPTTEISFSLTQAGFTSLSVYNAIGQEVARLIERDMAAGTHIVTFNAANLTSGVYFYRITTNNFTQVKKMMLMK